MSKHIALPTAVVTALAIKRGVRAPAVAMVAMPVATVPMPPTMETDVPVRKEIHAVVVWLAGLFNLFNSTVYCQMNGAKLLNLF